MGKKVAVVHTSLVSINELKALFAEILPDVTMYNIIDESLLAEVKANGWVTPGIQKRMNAYYVCADSLGVDLILNQCSSVGEAADIAAKQITTPVLKIDIPMAEEAVRLGKKVALVATVASTVAPSVRNVENTAKEMGKEVEVVPYLVDGALTVLMEAGGQEKHNAMVMGAVEKAAQECDVVVLAQGSMTVLIPLLGDIKVPVLTSPRMAVERIKKELGL